MKRDLSSLNRTHVGIAGLSRRDVLLASLAGAAALQLGRVVPAAAQSGTINFFNYTSFATPELFDRFKQETGFDINLIGISDIEDVLIKVRTTGGKDMDLLVANDLYATLFLKEGLIEPVDPRKLPSYKADSLFDFWSSYQPYLTPEGALFGLPIDTEIQGPIYRSDRVTEPVTSWSLLMDPRYKGRISWRDTTRNLFWMGSLMGFEVWGRRPGAYHLEPDELQKVQDELIKAKRSVNPIIVKTGSEQAKLFISGEAEVGYGANSQIAIVANGGGPRMDLGYVKSPERNIVGSDILLLVANAANRDASLAWIDFQLRPESQDHFFTKTGFCFVGPGTGTRLASGPLSEVISQMGCMKSGDAFEGGAPFAPPSDIEAWTAAWNEVLAA